MIFRPKIFISSTFVENDAIRQKIREYFYSVGAEPLLYEKEPTPSVTPMSFKESITDADFVILIIKESYSTLTGWNLSGTYEEYLLARRNKIPVHVYLLKSAISVADNPLIAEFKRTGISYYYFDDDGELFEKLKQTTFIIAKEIMLAQVVKNNLPDNAVVRLAGNSDYKKAIAVIQVIESMKACAEAYDLDYIRHSIILECISPIAEKFHNHKHFFINWKLNELLNTVVMAAKEFILHHGMDFTTGANQGDYPIAGLGRVNITRGTYDKHTDWLISTYEAKLVEFFEKFEDFKKCVQELRTEIDIIG